MKLKLLGRYIIIDPEICHGTPTFIGTRIMVEQVLNRWKMEWQGNITKDAIAEAVRLASKAFSQHSDDFAIDVTTT